MHSSNTDKGRRGPSGRTRGTATQPRPTPVLQTVDRALTTLLLFTPKRPEWGLTDTANALGVSKSMAARMLKTLCARGLLIQDSQTRRYRVGLRVLEIALAAHAANNLHRAALPVLKRLVDETGETAFLTVVDGDEAVTLDRVEARNSLKFSLEVGTRWPLHVGAANRVLLAFLPRAEREEYLTRPLERFTDRTISDPDKLLSELTLIRERGFTHSLGELTPGVHALGAPILGPTGDLLGAVCLAGPEVRFGPSILPTLEGKLRAAATEIASTL